MRKENAYDFRKKLLQIHESGLRNKDRKQQKDEFWLGNGATIKTVSIGEVIETAVNDFKDYLAVSMGVSAEVVSEGEATITVALAEDVGVDLGEFKAYKGFMIETSEKGISIFAHDERGAAQALYYLEDMMTFAAAPAVAYGIIKKKAMFSPQMVHSGYEHGIYPDEYMARIAHEGRDAIMFVYNSPEQFAQINDLIYRGAKYGLDVYAYSALKSEMSPEDPAADEYYDSTYGQLFRNCPGLRGVTLVGESVEFPSCDPHVAPGFGNRTKVDGIPTGKVTSGWYPCEDYPSWLNVLKKAIRKYNKDADIVFWTYNWGWQPEDARVKLIESLPTDISLLVTFEMYEPQIFSQGKGMCIDYTLASEGPSGYFKSEAAAAKKRGIRLYSMTNSGGRTWDFGTAPYEPMPQQWMRRYEQMKSAKEKWNLSGIMESHDYGFTPSIISKLSKHAFMEPAEPMQDILKKILCSEYGKENYECTEKALNCFSEAIRHYVPSNADQYGAFRIGPSYPFNLFLAAKFPNWPSWCNTGYSHDTGDHISPLGLRIYGEIDSLDDCISHMEQGMDILRGIENPNEKLKDLIRLGHFLTNCVKTGRNAKKWYTLSCRMRSSCNAGEMSGIFDEMEELLYSEIKNVEDTIPLVEEDSSLGWEASMERSVKNSMDITGPCYMTDRWHLEWKIRQVKYVLESEIAGMRGAIKKHLS